MAGRATPGGEGDTWRGGRHVAGRATRGGEGDTWRGVRHVAGSATLGGDCHRLLQYR